jgi:hypothetical protein
MADTNDLARAREALSAPSPRVDATLLGAVHQGLLSVPVAPERSRADDVATRAR